MKIFIFQIRCSACVQIWHVCSRNTDSKVFFHLRIRYKPSPITAEILGARLAGWYMYTYLLQVLFHIFNRYRATHINAEIFSVKLMLNCLAFHLLNYMLCMCSDMACMQQEHWLQDFFSSMHQIKTQSYLSWDIGCPFS